MQISNSTPHVLSVSELNQTVARLLEKSIPLCWISGEISNFIRASSGHWYFTLKDSTAQVKAVMFKTRSLSVDFMPREGDKVEVRAIVSLYAPRGEYQLSVEGIRRAGLGNLYEAFLKLKQKLSDAGLFNSERKKQLPLFPTCIGIISSPQAAALRDILITLKRRAPHVQIVLYPTPVQGTGSATKIMQAIEIAVLRNECDVLLLARGGGSIEDLWSFNDEQLAFSIASSPIPIITGIGHETDFTIADFVADLRAPTPTAAAEMAVSAREDLLLQLERFAAQLQRSLRRKLDQENQTLDSFARRLISPAKAIHNERLKLSGMQLKIRHSFIYKKQQAWFEFEQLKQKLVKLKPDLSLKRLHLQQLTRQLQTQVNSQFALQRQSLHHLTLQLELLNPQRTLERGYAIILNEKGKILSKPAQFNAPHHITVKLADGEVDLGIASVQQKMNFENIDQTT